MALLMPPPAPKKREKKSDPEVKNVKKVNNFTLELESEIGRKKAKLTH